MVVCILDVLWKSEFFRNLGEEDDKTKTIFFLTHSLLKHIIEYKNIIF